MAVVTFAATASAAGRQKNYASLDEELNHRALNAPASQTTSVIVRFTANEVPPEFEKYVRSFLPLVDGYVLDLPNSKLKTIGSDVRTLSASHNGTVQAFNFRTGIQSGAFFARHVLGINGAGVGVALLDSGVAPNLETPVTYFRDFLTPDPQHLLDRQCKEACDPNGHGTHVAGTIAGNGLNSGGTKSGIAPGASLFALRVLGADGTGTVEGVINALHWVLKNARKDGNNIRVVNLSFGMRPPGRLPNPHPLATMLDRRHGDPLAIATKALVDAGIFVVAAGGNVGQITCSALPLTSPDHVKPGKCDVWGGITAPGTYPWVFTAGANSSEGSFTRTDDIRAKFSSRGPAFPLQNAKPDMLAGAVGIESTSAPGSVLFGEATAGGYLVDGGLYTSLSGTSQAAAVVSGVAAQMLQANPKLTPNLIKAILEYTSQEYKKGEKGYSPLEQGAGFLNALGAVQLSRFYATAKKGQRVPVSRIWSQHFIWGNFQLSGGLMLPNANAWSVGVDWGAAATADGDNIVWGTSCGSRNCGDSIVWGTSDGDNIVWGTADGDNIVWGTGDGDNIVWGTSDGDNIVWGTDCGGADCDNIVWGTAGDGDNIVWGTAGDGDNIVWGTAGDGDNIVWGTGDGDNIVWGTAGDGDNIVWGTGDGDNIVWGTSILEHLPATQMEWYQLFLNRQFDTWWVAREFGDSLVWSGGHHTPKPTKVTRPRKLPASHKD